MLRVCLEAHRKRGTLDKALEFPCGAGGEGGPGYPLLHHVIISPYESATPEAKVATARLLVKEFGADAVAHYAQGSPYDEVTPLLVSASLGNVEMMEFLISGRSVCLRLLSSLYSSSLFLTYALFLPITGAHIPSEENVPSTSYQLGIPFPLLPSLSPSSTVLLACI